MTQNNYLRLSDVLHKETLTKTIPGIAAIAQNRDYNFNYNEQVYRDLFKLNLKTLAITWIIAKLGFIYDGYDKNGNEINYKPNQIKYSLLELTNEFNSFQRNSKTEIISDLLNIDWLEMDLSMGLERLGIKI
jgi:hypothetical protein